jgi:hypothetical protein
MGPPRRERQAFVRCTAVPSWTGERSRRAGAAFSSGVCDQSDEWSTETSREVRGVGAPAIGGRRQKGGASGGPSRFPGKPFFLTEQFHAHLPA